METDNWYFLISGDDRSEERRKAMDKIPKDYLKIIKQAVSILKDLIFIMIALLELLNK